MVDFSNDYCYNSIGTLRYWMINPWLARGRALQIVTIKPDEFLTWREARGLPNTAAPRLRYVETKAHKPTAGDRHWSGPARPTRRPKPASAAKRTTL